MNGAFVEGVQGMTGFARADGAGLGSRWSWEIRSVNGKGLDVRFRAGPGFEQLERAARERVAKRFSRGTIQLAFTRKLEDSAATVRVNRLALDELVKIAREIRTEAGGTPLIEQLLSIRGIVEIIEAEEGTEDLRPGILKSLDQALDALAAMRLGEGVEIAKLLNERLDRIEALTATARSNPARSPEAIRARLAEQVNILLEASSTLDPERLYQEAALLANRADISEEIDRLAAHVTAARSLLASGEAVGRRLDFLAQEFNRETNTLCAKSNDRGLTAIGLDLKAAVDQFREQVQNLE